MTVLLVLAAVVFVLVAAASWFKWGAVKRLRFFEWNDRLSYIRLWPNPGFQFRPRGRYFHWCRHRGRGVH